MTAEIGTAVVHDPTGAAGDPSMPFLKDALDPEQAGRELLPFVSGRGRLTSIQVLRHKPGRRCLVEYRFTDPMTGGELVILGKTRARSTDRTTFQVVQALRSAGFGDDAPDGIMTPEPLGVVPAYQMWLQRKVPGSVVTGALAEPGGVELAERIANAIHKLHRSGVPAKRSHTPEDELRILRQRLEALAAGRADLAPQLMTVYEQCAYLAGELPILKYGIHRDFYPDQVLVDGSDLYLLDLDLYAAGDPALDIGNFAGHLVELGVRKPELAPRMNEAADAFIEGYLALDPETSRRSIDIYTTLTLARHIQLSTQFPERRHTTETLLSLCQHRLNENHA